MADPKISEGARAERKAMRSMLRRRLRAERGYGNDDSVQVLEWVLEWVLARQKRYDRAKGGLGREAR